MMGVFKGLTVTTYLMVGLWVVEAGRGMNQTLRLTNDSSPVAPRIQFKLCTTNLTRNENGRIPPGDVCALDYSFFGLRYAPRRQLIKHPRLVNLSLAHNNITVIGLQAFRDVTSLENLDLSHNKLKSIARRAFARLGSLLYLDLSYNQLTVWLSSVFKGLTSLVTLNIRYNKLTRKAGTLYPTLPVLRNLLLQGNVHFTLSPAFFTNSSTLRFIEGTSVSKKCRLCNFTRLEDISFLLKYECQYIPEEYKSHFEREGSQAIIFSGECKRRQCRLDITDFVSKGRKMRRNRCWETLQKLIPLEVALGCLAIAFSTLLITVVMTSKPLRRSSTYLIMSHIALCDILRGLYAILLAIGHSNATEVSFRRWRKNHCPFYRSIFLLSEILGVSSCILATLERYLKVVHWTRSDWQLTPKKTLVALAGIWVFGVVFCVLIYEIDAAGIPDNKMCLLIRDNEKHNVFFIEIALVCLIVLCLFSASLYIRILVFASRSGQEVGIKRECKLAKKIGILFASNAIFLLGPNLAMVVFIYENKTDFNAVWDTVLRMWLPPMCLVVNSCLNPWYFCFRSDKFLVSLKKSFLGLLHKGNQETDGKTRAGRKPNRMRNRVNARNSYEMMPAPALND